MGLISDGIITYLREKDKGVSDDALERISARASGLGVRLARNLSKQILPYIPKPKESVELPLYPSAATKCARQVAMSALGFPAEPLLPGAKLKFLVGDLIETAALALISAAFVVTGNNDELSVVIAGKPRRGRTDGIITVGGRRKNLEIKSMSEYGFKSFVENGPDDTFGYLGQANVYMRALLGQKLIDEPGATVFVGVERNSGNIFDREVLYDSEIAEAADRNFETVEKAVAAGKLPARPYELNSDLSLPLNCAYCQYKYSCYADPLQRVGFDDNGNPQHSDETRALVKRFMTKGRTGMRPSWKWVNV